MFVNIKKGVHRNKQIVGIFPVLQPYKVFATGGAVTVKVPHTPPFKGTNARIKVELEDFFYCTMSGEEASPEELAELNPIAKAIVDSTATHVDHEANFFASESDEDAMQRISATFDMLEEVTQATATGVIRGLVVSGSAGIGKSHGVEAKLNEYNMFNVLKNNKPNFEVITGHATPVALYQKLFLNRHKGYVTVLDDMDTILFDEQSLNILKAVLDTKKKRNVSWLAESRVLKDEDIPNTFEFEGSIIFLTNLNFEKTNASKIKSHLEAIMSRCHYLDLTISTQRDQVLRIKQIVSAGLLSEFDFQNGEADTIVAYIEENANYLREISLRTCIKIAELMKSMPNRWLEMTNATMLRRDAKYKKLAEQ